MMEDNTVFVLQKALNIHKARVTKGSVKEFLLSHPRYPSLKSVCDGLKKWNIDHYPLRLSKEEILEIEPPFIVHMGGELVQLALVEKIKDGNVIFTINQGKIITQNKEEFSAKLSGGVIVMEPNQQSGEKNYWKNRQNELIKAVLLPFIVISVVLFLLYMFYSRSGLLSIQSYIPLMLFITKAIGVAASVFLVLHEFKIHTKLSDKICGFSSGG
jgi:ABC-type bacteriocin/lantibiotic exporter with double-glycine peptidase domain